jgi:hypothetical protein
MSMSDEEIKSLSQKITVGMTANRVWKIGGEPCETVIRGFNTSEEHYRNANWQLTIRLDKKERVTDVELRPLTPEEKAAWEFRKRLQDIATGQGEELPEPLQQGGTIEDEEYEVYSGLCFSTDLFIFSHPETTFDDLTRDEINHIWRGKKRNLGNLQGRVLEYLGLQEDFEQKNARRTRLEKRFRAQNGYQFLSEREQAYPEDKSSYFILSRVGFSSDRKTALLYIEYVAACGYYVLFRCGKEKRGREKWRLSAYSRAWVS